MKRSTLLSLIVGLSILGLADAWYLAETALTGGKLVCDINGLSGCNVVAQSAYSHFFGIPLGVYGVAFYVLFLITSLIALYRPHRMVDTLLALLALIGLGVSAYFLYIQLALIKAICIYCIGSAAIAFLLFLLVGWLWYRKPVPAPIAPATL